MDSLAGMSVFIRVVETGSFSKASASLGVTQPTATKHVAALEKRLGARLFHRSTRGVTPTEAGPAYYDKCKVIAHELEAADSLAALMQSRVQGTLRISSSVAFGRRVLTPLVLRFMQQHPGLQIDLSFATATSTWSSRVWTWPCALSRRAEMSSTTPRIRIGSPRRSRSTCPRAAIQRTLPSGRCTRYSTS